MVPLPHPTPHLASEAASLLRWTHKSNAMLGAQNEKLRIIQTTAEDVRKIVHQQVPTHSQANRLSIKVVIPINCDAMLLQRARQRKNETLRREGERERYVTLWMCPSSHRRCCIWKPRRCSWRCRRYSPSSRHQLSVWLVFLALQIGQNVKVKLVFDIPPTYCMNSQKGDCHKRNTLCNTQAT